MKEKLKKKIKFVATLLKLRKINSNYDYRHTYNIFQDKKKIIFQIIFDHE